MLKCPKCENTTIVKTGISKKFAKCCCCNYIWQSVKESKPRPKQKEDNYENTAADDYLDYLHGQW